VREEREWWELSGEQIVALSTDVLALAMLRAYGGSARSRASVQEDVERPYGGYGKAPRAVVAAALEAWHWLLRKGLVIPAPRGQELQRETPIEDRWERSRLGERIAAHSEGLAALEAIEQIEFDLHPRIAADVRAEFLRFKFDLAVYTAMKTVEIALREKIGAGPERTGIKLVNEAFSQGSGPLWQPESKVPVAEQTGVANLFRGAIAAFRNPETHRAVDYGDPVEAAEIVTLASLLLRTLDRLPDPAPTNG
jgi:uncharacterized protein (TIGR02391 family)